MYRLLIVDDEKLIRNGLNQYFQDNNTDYEVVGLFGDGIAAFEYLMQNPAEIDVVITDIKMHKMSGIELSQRIREAQIDVQIVFISGYEDFEYAKKAIDYHIFSYLLKPLRFEQIDDVLRRLKDVLDKQKPPFPELNNEMQYAMFTHLIHEIESGTIYGKDPIIKRAAKLHLPLEIFNYPCCYFTFYKHEEVHTKYTDDQYDTAIANFMHAEDILLYKIYSDKSSVTFFAVANHCITLNDFQVLLDSLLHNAATIVIDTLHFSIHLKCQDYFENIFFFSEYAHTLTDDSILNTIKNVFFTDLTIGDYKEAEKSFALFSERLSKLGKSQRELILEEFISAINLLTNNKFVPTELYQINTLMSDIEKYDNDSYKEKLLDKTMKYLTENYFKDISLTDIAGHVHLNSTYLGRIFKQRYGETITDSLIKIRVQKAKELLVQTDIPIYSIGEQVGYANDNYFIRIFKKNTGMTPGMYRKERIFSESE